MRCSRRPCRGCCARAATPASGKPGRLAPVPTTAASTSDLPAEEPPVPTPPQSAAVEAIDSAQGYHAFLLQGVTGSGKTEVYLRCIDTQLDSRPPEPGAGAGDRADAATRGPVPAPLSGRGHRAAALRPHRPAAAGGLGPRARRPRRDHHRHALGRVRAAAARRAHRRRRGARQLAQAAGRLPLLRPRHRRVARAPARRAGGARLGDALPRESRQRRGRALPATCACRNAPAGAKPPSVHLVDLRRHLATDGLAPPLVDGHPPPSRSRTARCCCISTVAAMRRR